MIPHRLQRLLESRDLEAIPATDEEVVAYWRKSLRAFRDSYVPGLSPEGAFARAYQSALDAATALVRLAGYRVRSTNRHHYATFYAVQALGDEALAEGAFELDAARTDRHVALYEADEEEERTKEHLEGLQDTLTHFLPAAHRWLTAQRPGLKDELQSPSDISPAG